MATTRRVSPQVGGEVGNPVAYGSMSMMTGPLMLVTLVVTIVLLAVVLIVLRNYLLYVTFGVLFLVLIGVSVFMYITLDRHKAAVGLLRAQAKATPAKQYLISESERGVVVLDPKTATPVHFTNLPDRPTYRDGTLLSPTPPETKQLVPPYPTDWPGLVAAGFMVPKSPYILGFDLETGAPLKMGNLSSLGIGGVQGSGKSTTTLLLATESVVRYAGKLKMTIVDPHMDMRDTDDGTPLAELLEPFDPFFLRARDLVNPTLGFGDEMETLLNVWWGEFQRRASNGIWTDYWVGLADEFAMLVSDPQYGEAIMELIIKINEQARKVGMFWLVTTQSWKASRTGGKTDLRQSIASFVLHNMAKELSKLVVPDVYAKETPRLKIGQALLYSRGQMSIGQVPYITREDAADAIAEYVGGSVVVEEELVLPYNGPIWGGGGERSEINDPTTPLLAYHHMEPLQQKQVGGQRQQHYTTTHLQQVMAPDLPSEDEVVLIQRLYAVAVEKGVRGDPIAIIAANVYGRDPGGVGKVEMVLGS